MTLAALIGGLLGIVVGAVAVFAFRFSEREYATEPQPAADPGVPTDVARVLSVLGTSTVVVGPDDEVVHASVPARSLGLVVGSRLVIDDVLELVHQVRRDGEIRQREFPIRRDRYGWNVVSVQARVAPIGQQLTLVLVEDRTKERRLDAIRRDFVANVSHELKTPIGALRLLADAVYDAADDPEAVDRFAERMQVESERLSRLVQQIIELSRVQADDPVEQAALVRVDDVVEAAIDRSRVDASAKEMTLVRAGEPGLAVLGNEQQLTIALGNLVENAVTYSPEHTRVVVDVRLAPAPDSDDHDSVAGLAGAGLSAADAWVDIAVSDRGVGIPGQELERVFERFYRVDRARSRETGGTGLGLSIVKHVAARHGGTVGVWSVEGEGSTFTLRLPLHNAPREAAPPNEPNGVNFPIQTSPHVDAPQQEVVT